jgi:hypothetical protein
MLYSVEETVQPPKNDEQRYTKNNKINNDLDAEVSGGFSQYDSENGAEKPRKAHYNKYDSGINSREGHNLIQSNMSTPKGIPSKAPTSRSKLASMSKGSRSRISHIRGKSGPNGITQKTGQITIAMQVLNMDEDEKE